MPMILIPLLLTRRVPKCPSNELNLASLFLRHPRDHYLNLQRFRIFHTRRMTAYIVLETCKLVSMRGKCA